MTDYFSYLFLENLIFYNNISIILLAHLSLLRVSFWDTAMSVVHVEVRDVQDVRDVCLSTF